MLETDVSYMTVMVHFSLDGFVGVFYFVCCAWSWKEEETDALQNLLLSTRLLHRKIKPSQGMELCHFIGWPLPIGKPWAPHFCQMNNIYIEVGASTLKSCFPYLKPCFLE